MTTTTAPPTTSSTTSSATSSATAPTTAPAEGRPDPAEDPARPGRPATVLVSLLAALSTWVTLLAWTPFSEQPGSFMGPLLQVVLGLAGVGIALRTLRLPAAWVVLTQVVLTLLWLQLRYAGGAAIGGLVPTPTSVRAVLGALGDAVEASRQYSAPVPSDVPEFTPLLVTAGAGAAVLVDLLAVGLRRAPLAGLPLLAVYTAPVSILTGGVSWVTFAASAACFLALVAAGEERRLAHWGRQLTPRPRTSDLWSGPPVQGAVWSSARKIGLTATGLALAAPLLLPHISPTTFGGGGEGGGGGGTGNGVSLVSPMVSLRRNLVRGADIPLVTERTNDPDPAYLRVSVLNDFDGDQWRPADRQLPSSQRADGAIPGAPGLAGGVSAKSYVSRFSVSDDFRSRWLPTPYPATYVRAEGDWRYDLNTLDFLSFDDDLTTSGLSYTVRSSILQPTATQLTNATAAPTSVSAPNTALPRGLPESVARLAASVTKGDDTAFAQAVSLQEFFRSDGGFTYDLQRAPGTSTQSLVRFLGTGPGSRTGYCEQFSAAMALMGRTLGIPSRVAVGFLSPDRTGPGTYVYSSHDLHAWPEMYFGGVGWVRFEPTPPDRTGDAVPGYTRQQAPDATDASSSSAPSAAPSVNRVDRDLLQQTDSTTASGAASAGRSTGWWAAGVLVLLALTLLVPQLTRVVRTRRRWARADTPRAWVEAAWAELRAAAVDLGVSWDEGATLRVLAAKLEPAFGDPELRDDGAGRTSHRGAAANPAAVAALRRLVSLLERARYARDLPAATTTRDQVRADLHTCVAGLRAGASRRARSRARWFPASVTVALAGARRGRRTSAVGGANVDRTVRS